MKYILLTFIALAQVAFVSARTTYNIKDLVLRATEKSQIQ